MKQRKGARITGAIDCSSCAVLRSLVDELRALWQEERERADKLVGEHQAQLAALLSRAEPQTVPASASGKVASFRRPTSAAVSDPRVEQAEPAFSQPPDVLARLQDLQFHGRHAPPVGGAFPAPPTMPTPAEDAAADAAIAADVDDIAAPGAVVALE